ncbi:MAG: putative ATPase [Dokdonia sp.]|jgi:predicted ATPase
MYKAISMPKRVLLIGGPSTGKTTLLKELEDQGYPCLKEVSREVIKTAQNQGVEQLFVTEPLLFSELLLRARIDQYDEAAKATSDLVFIDRGIPDTVAYMDFIKQTYTNEFTQACHKYVYDAVYVLPPWEAIHTTDEERYEDFEHAQKLQVALINTYEHYGYFPVEVPIGPVKDRAYFLLNHLLG